MFLITLLDVVFISIIGVLIVLGIYFIAGSKGSEMTIEPEDPQALIDSEFELRDSVINEFVNSVLASFDVREGEAEIKQFQPGLNFMIIKITFGEYLATCSIDFNKQVYNLHLNYYCVRDGETQSANMERVFKMNKTNWSVNFTDVANFISEFEEEVLGLSSFEDLIQNIVELAKDPELVKLADEGKYNMLYDAAEHMVNIIYSVKDKKLRRQLIMPYAKVLGFICANEKTSDMVAYFKMTPKELSKQTELVKTEEE